MTVSQVEASPSRAGSLPLVGGDLALDFTNTESGRGSASHQNHLRNATNVVAWLERANALTVEDARWLKDETARRADLAGGMLDTALALRSAIHGVGAAIGRGEAPQEDALASLASLHARLIARASLAAEPASLQWRWSVRDSPVEAALGPIALAAVTLFTRGDFARIKECGGHECGWLFHDTTKNNRRRWCEMEVCGNRAKQRRLMARRRQG